MQRQSLKVTAHRQREQVEQGRSGFRADLFSFWEGELPVLGLNVLVRKGIM